VLLVAVTTAVRWAAQLAGATVREGAARIQLGILCYTVGWSFDASARPRRFGRRETNLMSEDALPYDTRDAVTDHGLGLHHLQLAIPPGTEDKARSFYVDVLGMTEVQSRLCWRLVGACGFGRTSWRSISAWKPIIGQRVRRTPVSWSPISTPWLLG
jgi:hypothetical protein